MKFVIFIGFLAISVLVSCSSSHHSSFASTTASSSSSSSFFQTFDLDKEKTKTAQNSNNNCIMRRLTRKFSSTSLEKNIFSSVEKKNLDFMRATLPIIVPFRGTGQKDYVFSTMVHVLQKCFICEKKLVLLEERSNWVHDMLFNITMDGVILVKPTKECLYYFRQMCLVLASVGPIHIVQADPTLWHFISCPVSPHVHIDSRGTLVTVSDLMKSLNQSPRGKSIFGNDENSSLFFATSSVLSIQRLSMDIGSLDSMKAIRYFLDKWNCDLPLALDLYFTDENYNSNDDDIIVDISYLSFALSRIKSISLQIYNCPFIFSHYLALSNAQHRRISQISFLGNKNAAQVSSFLSFAQHINHLTLFQLSDPLFYYPDWLSLFQSSYSDDNDDADEDQNVPKLVIEKLVVNAGNKKVLDLVSFWAKTSFLNRHEATLHFVVHKFTLVVPAHLAAYAPICDLKKSFPSKSRFDLVIV